MSDIIRIAVVEGKANDCDAIRRYLPTNYGASTYGMDVVITGRDYNGYTMKDYVLPRLASGMYFAREL